MTDKYKLRDPSPSRPSSPPGKPLSSSHLSTSKLTGKSQSSSFQMMQELLEGATQAQQEEYVTRAEKESWGELLTNKYKMETYRAGLLRYINRGAENSEHLKLLLFLLGQIEGSSLEVHYGDQLSLEFNAGRLKEQSREISQLREERERTQLELQEVSKEYEKILLNFNAVIQNLMLKQSQPAHK